MQTLLNLFVGLAVAVALYLVYVYSGARESLRQGRVREFHKKADALESCITAEGLYCTGEAQIAGSCSCEDAIL